MQRFQLLGIALACAALAACEENADVAPQPQQVRVISAASGQYQTGAEITGEVRARIQTELSFRVSGRVIERRVDVGQHVRAGDVLARLDDAEQQADVSVARAALEAATAVARQKTLAFERAKTLLQSQVIAQQAFEAAQKELASAEALREAAEAALATAADVLSFAELKAEADGIITARSLEVGQVVSPAQPAFTLAHDGPRDAVFDVFEAFFLDGPPLADVEVAPVGDRSLGLHAKIREISPAIDINAGTIRIKAELRKDTQWPLGSPVVGTLLSTARRGIVLPFSAIASDNGEPAVWVVHAESKSVALHRISVGRYRKSDLIVASGINPSDLVVTEGGKFLKEGQAVAWEGK